MGGQIRLIDIKSGDGSGPFSSHCKINYSFMIGYGVSAFQAKQDVSRMVSGTVKKKLLMFCKLRNYNHLERI